MHFGFLHFIFIEYFQNRVCGVGCGPIYTVPLTRLQNDNSNIELKYLREVCSNGLMSITGSSQNPAAFPFAPRFVDIEFVTISVNTEKKLNRIHITKFFSFFLILISTIYYCYQSDGYNCAANYVRVDVLT